MNDTNGTLNDNGAMDNNGAADNNGNGNVVDDVVETVSVRLERMSSTEWRTVWMI